MNVAVTVWDYRDKNVGEKVFDGIVEGVLTVGTAAEGIVNAIRPTLPPVQSLDENGGAISGRVVDFGGTTAFEYAAEQVG